jgi:hypothetical protein
LDEETTLPKDRGLTPRPIIFFAMAQVRYRLVRDFGAEFPRVVSQMRVALRQSLLTTILFVPRHSE